MDYEINLPILDNVGGYKSLIYIETSSGLSAKESLEKMALYFKREFRYDYLQYDALEDNDDCVGVLFTERAFDLVQSDDHYPNRVIGGACFHEKKESEYELDWVWLHPFARNRKHLKNNWLNFKKRFGEFTVTEPLSAHMASFVKRHA